MRWQLFRAACVNLLDDDEHALTNNIDDGPSTARLAAAHQPDRPGERVRQTPRRSLPTLPCSTRLSLRLRRRIPLSPRIPRPRHRRGRRRSRQRRRRSPAIHTRHRHMETTTCLSQRRRGRPRRHPPRPRHPVRLSLSLLSPASPLNPRTASPVSSRPPNPHATHTARPGSSHRSPPLAQPRFPPSLPPTRLPGPAPLVPTPNLHKRKLSSRHAKPTSSPRNSNSMPVGSVSHATVSELGVVP